MAVSISGLETVQNEGIDNRIYSTECHRDLWPNALLVSLWGGIRTAALYNVPYQYPILGGAGV